jgi:hypothetical protein
VKRIFLPFILLLLVQTAMAFPLTGRVVEVSPERVSVLSELIDSSEQVQCPDDVRECPDGSYVKRVAPNCEFEPCLEACTRDVFMCPDGSFVIRDPNNNCEFFPCPDRTVCTDDVRECPDGSYVKRVAPDCEFEPCANCGVYSRDGQRKEICAVCGDNVCEPFEKCVPSVCSNGICTADCGPLYCPEDCEKKAVCGNNICEEGEKETCPRDCAVGPMCQRPGTSEEGWYIQGKLIKKEICSCQAVCRGARTEAEGYYNSCTGTLIQSAKCSQTFRLRIRNNDLEVAQGNEYLEIKSKDTAVSKENLVIEENKISMRTQEGIKEIMHLPEEVAAMVTGEGLITHVNKIEIKNINEKPVYVISGEMKYRFLGIIPVTRAKTVTVDAQTNQVI